MNYQDSRRQYNAAGLSRGMLEACPIKQFDLWQRQALEANLADPTACSLATVEPQGHLWQRIVLLKSVDDGDFVFFTNYQSAKGIALAMDPRASLLFPWTDLERQVIVSGTVEKISEALSDEYFATRPRESQLGAWASQQSRVIQSRDALMTAFREVEARHAKSNVPRPPHWGGLRLTPQRIEFWQGGKNRLHDRFVYTRTRGGWVIERLQP